MTLQNLLKHPIYAGAYAYGRRQVDPRRQQAGRPSSGRVVAEPSDWFVLIKDVLPAYITWAPQRQPLPRRRTRRAASWVVLTHWAGGVWHLWLSHDRALWRGEQAAHLSV
jgi:hypothetical protein